MPYGEKEAPDATRSSPPLEASDSDSQRYGDQPSWFDPVVARLQAQKAHLTFACNNPGLESVLINVEDMRRLVDKGLTADSVFEPTTTVGVTSTVSDKSLEDWFPQKEMDYVEEFGPDIYIPCDRPIYEDQPSAYRQEVLGRYLNDLEEIVKDLAEHPVLILPLVKGVTPEERHRCFARFKQLDLKKYAYYCVQYFQEGNYRRELIHDVHAIARESDAQDLLLIGLQATKTLSEMPPVVTASAGLAWIEGSGLREEDMTKQDIQNSYGEFIRTVEKAIHGGQTGLSRWTDGTEVAYGD